MTPSPEYKPGLKSEPSTFSERKLGRRLFHNAAALAVGSNLNALGRLIIAGWIIRRMGATVFGEYALIGLWLTIAEWILDFGTTEVFVREANRAPGRRDLLLRSLCRAKVVQTPLAVLVFLTGLIAMQYSGQIIRAGIIAGISLVFIAIVVVCRAAFKSTLTMGREVVAESVSVLALLLLLPLVTYTGWGLMSLMAAYVISRGIFLAGCLVLSRDVVRLSTKSVNSAEARGLMAASLTIGIIGFIVALYTAADLLVLSRVAVLSEVAMYSGGQRLTQPLLMALNSIGVSVYPVLAFMKTSAQFRETCQRALETIILLGGLSVVGIWCGADFFMGLLGPEFAAGSDVLRIMALTCVIKAVSSLTGPVLFLMRAQTHALAYMCATLVVKIAVIAVLTPRMGSWGAAIGTLMVEAFFLLPLTLYFVHAFTGYTVALSRIGYIAAVAAGVIIVTRAILPAGIIGGCVAAVLYGVAVVALRIVNVAEVRALLRRVPLE
jgi:O-antigen/teichoic acid export membrane protein